MIYPELHDYKDTWCLPNEEWRTCTNPLLAIRYEVSNFARLRRPEQQGCDRNLPALMLSAVKRDSGYLNFTCRGSNSKGKTVYVHRLVAEAFIPNPDNLPQVNHKGSKYDNRPHMLEWTTGSNNAQDAFDRGLMSKRLTLKKLDYRSDEDMTEIYIKIITKQNTMMELAKEYSISRTTLSSVVNKRSRWELTDPIDIAYGIPLKPHKIQIRKKAA